MLGSSGSRRGGSGPPPGPPLFRYGLPGFLTPSQAPSILHPGTSNRLEGSHVHCIRGEETMSKGLDKPKKNNKKPKLTVKEKKEKKAKDAIKKG
jgi:hypothetical protein